MNIVYLIGNGFDINIGLKTSYEDFYDYYLKLGTDKSNIKKIKDCLRERKNIELWSDLEYALGECSRMYDNARDFQEVLLDINDRLREYIASENKRIKVNPESIKKLYNDLSNPFQYLTPQKQKVFSEYRSRWNNYGWNVNIISFNYTFSLEKLLEDKQDIEIGKHNSGPIKLSRVYHIHGTCNKTILVGINDIDQIKNESFRTDEDLTDIFVKQKANIGIEKLIDERCKSIIKEANLICTFGVSFGETDKLWWDKIRENINRDDFRCIIFDYKKDLNIDHYEFLLPSLKRKVIEKLMPQDNKTFLNRNDVEINSGIFNL